LCLSLFEGWSPSLNSAEDFDCSRALDYLINSDDLNKVNWHSLDVYWDYDFI